MPATSTIAGAIADATAARNDTGMLSTGIGIGVTHVSTARNFEPNVNTTADVKAIGGATLEIQSVSGAITGKNLKYLLRSAGTVAPDAEIAVGWVNKTGRTINAGEYAWGQEA